MKLVELFKMGKQLKSVEAPNVLTDIFNNIHDYKLEIYFEGDELVGRVKKKTKKVLKKKETLRLYANNEVIATHEPK